MAKSKGGGILARTARKATGLAKKAAKRAQRGAKSMGTPNRDVPPPTDGPSVQSGAKKATGTAKRAAKKAKTTTKKTVKKAQAQTRRTAKTAKSSAKASARRATRKAPASGRRTPSVDGGGPVHASGSKGAARKAPGGPPRGGKR